MIDQFGPSEQICLLNANAQCDRIWVSQLDGLRLAHIQTLRQEEFILKESDAAVSVRRAQISDSAAYEQCVRGCVGPKL
jgi:hypothetical protein